MEVLLSAPVVLWAAVPYYRRGWLGVVHRTPNMYTLIGLGVIVAFTYRLIATFLPGSFPANMRDAHGMVGVYFEVAAVIGALARTLTKTRRSGRGLVRAHGHRHFDRHRPWVVVHRPGAAPRLRPGECGRRAYHCLSVRSGARDAHFHHGRQRSCCPIGRALPRCRSDRVAPRHRYSRS